MAYTPHTWIDDDVTKPLSAARLSEMEAGIEDADNRLTAIEGLIIPSQAITYAATITPDAAAGTVFYCIATGNLVINDPANGVDGKMVTLAVQASGASRLLTLSDGTVFLVPTSAWWAGKFLYLDAVGAWLFSNGL